MITLTDIAAAKVKAAIANRGRGIGMRLAVKTTGCSGMAYVLEFADQLFEGDVEFIDKDVRLVISLKDLPISTGCRLIIRRKDSTRDLSS